jgi:hypothetical protein
MRVRTGRERAVEVVLSFDPELRCHHELNAPPGVQPEVAGAWTKPISAGPGCCESSHAAGTGIESAVPKR